MKRKRKVQEQEQTMGVETTFTRLIDKHSSALVIRKVTKYGFPIYVGIITDDNLSDFDETIIRFMEANKKDGWVNDIQQVRNLAGALAEELTGKYQRTEGVAVVLAVDKCIISSLYGDFMNHQQCRIEFFQLLNFSTNV